MKYATWNVRGISGKEVELVKEIQKVNIPIVGLTEIKMKGQGCKPLEDGALLFYSGITSMVQAQAGVGLLVHRDYTTQVKEWFFRNERLMSVLIEEKVSKELITVIVAYGPNDNDTVDNKDIFFEALQTLIDDAEHNNIILMGDLNGRIGNNTKGFEGIMGKWGETTRNNNGRRLLRFCANNELVIANSMFPHKNIHKYTRVVPSRDEKSIIDYIIIPKTEFPKVRNVKVKRGPEIGSDHFLVVMEKALKKCPERNKKVTTNKKNATYKICINKFKDEAIQREYKKKVEELAEMKQGWKTEINLENAWKNFKEILLKAAEQACGKRKCGGTKCKQTRWWSEEVKNEVKKKKEKWKEYLRTKTSESYQEYRNQRNKVKETVKAAKQKSWEEFGHFMEESIRDNQKLFYKVLKNMRNSENNNNCPLKFIKNKQGVILTKEKEILNRWKEYFSDLLNETTDLGIREDGCATEEIEQQEEEVQNQNEITEEEVTLALRKMKLGKAAGLDGIAPEMLRYMGEQGEEMLLKVCNLAWLHNVIPKDWEVSVILPIYKKGDNRDCTNHRGIALQSVPSKIYSRILESRLRSIVEKQLDEAQMGFRPNRGTQDAIFTLRQICEKAIEYDREVHLCFIDLEKAFDRVPWKQLWTVLKKRNVPCSLIQRIQSFYKTCRNCIRTSNAISEEFTVTSGVRQGDILSPLLFVLLMDDVIKSCSEMKKYHVGNWKLQGICASVLAYADDLVLISDTQEKLQFNLNLWTQELNKRKMNISLTKTKTVVISRRDTKHQIKIEETPLEQVDHFKYLGVIIAKDGKLNHEINARTTAAGKVFNSINSRFLRKREVSDKTKVAVFKSIYRPILTYGCESWALTSKLESRLQAQEMRYLRRVAGKTRRDRIRNQTIRSNLEINSLQNNIEAAQLRWFGHVHRMSDLRYPRQTLEARCSGRRPRGRRRTTWQDYIQKLLLDRGVSWTQAKTRAQNRTAWRSFCKLSTPDGT